MSWRDDLLPRGQGPDAEGEHVRPLLVEQVGPVARGERLVVALERLAALVHLPDHAPAVDHRLEAAHRDALLEREAVDRLDGKRLVVAVALDEDHPRRVVADRRLDPHAPQRDGHALPAQEPAGLRRRRLGRHLPSSPEARRCDRPRRPHGSLGPAASRREAGRAVGRDLVPRQDLAAVAAARARSIVTLPPSASPNTTNGPPSARSTTSTRSARPRTSRPSTRRTTSQRWALVARVHLGGQDVRRPARPPRRAPAAAGWRGRRWGPAPTPWRRPGGCG